MSFKTKEVPIAEATREELEFFVGVVLQLDYKQNTPIHILRGKIEAARPGTETITVPDAQVQQAAEAAAPIHQPSNAAPAPLERTEKVLGATNGKNDPVVDLLILESEEAGGKRAVFVGVNGTGILIPRGKRVQVAYRYYEALKNAVKSVPIQDQETFEINVHQVAAYPHQVYAFPSRDELDAWMGKTEERFAA